MPTAAWMSRKPSTQNDTPAYYTYKLSEFSTGVIKLITSFLIDRKFKVLVEGEFSMSRKITAEVPQCSVALVLYSVRIVAFPPVREPLKRGASKQASNSRRTSVYSSLLSNARNNSSNVFCAVSANQQYTALFSACQIPAFIGETEGSAEK
jgi:hypothetical protein